MIGECVEPTASSSSSAAAVAMWLSTRVSTSGTTPAVSPPGNDDDPPSPVSRALALPTLRVPRSRGVRGLALETRGEEQQEEEEARLGAREEGAAFLAAGR